MKFSDLYDFSNKPAICILENPKKKKALIFASNNPCLSVSNLISRLITKEHRNQDLIRDRKKLKLTVLETGVSDKWSVAYWYNHYTKLGYAFYWDFKPHQYILHIRVDYRYGAMVELCNKAKKGFVVGVFKTMDEAVGWVNEVYPDLDCINPVYACNLETIGYYRSSK